MKIANSRGTEVDNRAKTQYFAAEWYTAEFVYTDRQNSAWYESTV